MMNSLRILGLAAATALMPVIGNAAITLGTPVDNGNGSVSEFPSPVPNPLKKEVTFAGDAEFYAYIDVTVDRIFSITLEDYQPTDSADQRSVFFIQAPGGGYLTNEVSCTTSGQIAAMDDAGNKCNVVNGLNGTAGSPPPLSFTGLTAGTYRIGFYENFSPSRVQADFVISAVPLPAAGLMLVTALGGAAALRRRKKASAA